MRNNYKLIAVDFNPFEGNEIEKIVITNEPQREVWLSCILGGEEASLAYNESVSLELRGKFNELAFEKATHDLVARHESLRAVLSQNGEDLIIYKELIFDIIKSEDLSESLLVEKELSLKSFIQLEMAKSFDLYNGPLFRIYLHKLSEDFHYFTIIIHHLIGDGWSLGIILEDLSLLYNAHLTGKQPVLPKAEQISDYATQQTDFLKTEEYRSTTDFWLDKYKDNVPVVSLPLDFNRPALRTYKGKRNDYRLADDLLSQIQTLSKQTGSSLVVTLVAVFEVLLYHRTGQKDLVVGLPSAGQLATENLRLVGHCVNLLPLLSKIDPEQPFIDYLKKRRSEIYDAYDHQRLTFGELIRKLNIKRDKALVPLVPVVFNVDMGMDEKVEFTGLTHRLISNPRVSQTFEISLNVNGSKNALTFEWAYNTQLFTSATIDLMMQEFESLLRTLTTERDVLIGDALANEYTFPVMSVSKADYKTDKSIVELFTERAIKVPNNVALVFEDKQLTYLELDILSNQLANYLIGKGIKNESLVPICINRSLEMIIGILGIIKTGAAYIPIDPLYPIERINYILNDLNSDFVISNAKSSENFSCNLILLDSDIEQIKKAATTKPNVHIQPEQLIYIIYTSGSTGQPKGVMIAHESLNNYITAQTDYFGISSQEKILQFSNYCFDASAEQIFLALLNGACLVLMPEVLLTEVSSFYNYINEKQVSHLHATPGFLESMNTEYEYSYLKRIISAGDLCKVELAKKWLYKVDFYNKYGPTETTISVLEYKCAKAEIDYLQVLPIGKAIKNSTVHLLDEHLRPVKSGEIYVSGIQLAKGYLNQPESNGKNFINSPFKDGERLYKTGDLGRWTADENIEFLGRVDDQIKIRGFRIEIGEIENKLRTCIGVKQCAVIAINQETIGKRLIAYVVTSDPLYKENIKQDLLLSLPGYMVPSLIIKLDQLPLTSNKKVDRKELVKIGLSSAHEKKEFRIPKTENQKLIAEIWKESLGLTEINIDDDFFELGGHSMIAIKVMVEIEKQTGIRLPLAVLFDNSTIEKLALSLTKPDQEMNWKSLIPIKKSGNKPPLYIIHGQGMNIIIFKSLLQKIDKDQPILGLQPIGLNPEDEPADSIERIAEGYVQEILKNDPEGPYLLMGYSSGGTIALEMSEQLLKLSKKVSFLGLLDTYYDGDSYSNLLKATKFGQIFNHGIKTLGYAFFYLSKYPKDFITHKKNFVLGTLYNNYKKFNPIKKDHSNPLYVLDHIQKTHKKAFEQYKLKKYQTDVVLFRGNDKKMTYIPNMETNGFAPYMGGKLTLVDIPLEHLDFFAPAYINIFAEKLQSELNKSHTTNG